ncbi:glycine zipper 2TM domain-containing protein [Xenophilus arseniciresistens]|uniref:Glycine zipper 2TM domain-containing protein n=1 Tax=Xenophilus arseniciresistens TaxID=1283306 RepID=A0AAE3SYP4_9BURK|nr:glycine zipper 2TM domain-containing protein [Xenophilus arseniciresistens]MDA7415715.1 glycine zipper 2TM domain-containing protein [Xenophilus arseniciresistens]
MPTLPAFISSSPRARRWLRLGAALTAVAALSACVVAPPVYHQSSYPYQPAPRTYPAYPAQVAPYGTLEYGHVANIDVMRSERPGYGTSGGGAVAGGLIGGVVGNQFGQGSGRAAATALGLVGGALLGNAIEAQNNGPRAHESYRISIQTDRGEWRVFDVPHPGDLQVGDRVRIDNGQISRY